MAETNSAVGINLYPVFVDGKRGALDNIIRHINYVMEFVGEKI